MSDAKYSASLTGEPFLFYEIKQVARLKLDGLSDLEIGEEVKTKNLFQYSTEKSIDKRVRAAMKRVRVLDQAMLYYIVKKPSITGRVINLYAIMKTNRLAYDFIIEVVGEKFDADSLLLEKKDINEFFLAKREQNYEVAHWKDYTIKKLKQVLIRIIVEAGILESRSNGRLQRLNLDSEVANHFKAIGEAGLLKAMGINI